MAAKKDLCSFAGGVAAGSPRAASVSAISGADGAMSVRGTSENLSVRPAVAGGGAGSAGGDSGVEDVRGIDLNDGGVPVPGAPFSNMAALALTFDVAILAWGIVAKVRHPVLSFSPLLPSDATRFSPSTTTTGGHRRTLEKANFWNRFPTLPSLHPLSTAPHENGLRLNLKGLCQKVKIKGRPFSKAGYRITSRLGLL